MVVVEVLARVVGDVWALLPHSWPFLLISAAAALPVYVGAERKSCYERRSAPTVHAVVHWSS